MSTRQLIAPAILALALALAVIACKDDKKAGKDAGPSSAKPAEPAATEVELSALGVESPKVFGYRWGKGRADYERAEELAGAAKPDWDAVIAAAQKSLDADANHLAARFLLGVARARSGDAAGAIESLGAAMAADPLRFVPEFRDKQLLAAFRDTPAGRGLVAAADGYAAKVVEAAAGGILVVAKRGRFRMPTKPGDRYASSRGELYAYDLESRRYLRLTHSGETLIGVVRSPSGDRIATLRSTRLRIPAPDSGQEAVFVDLRVGVLDAKTFEPIGKEARLTDPTRRAMLYYQAGEELHLQVPGSLYAVDFEGGHLNPSSAQPLPDFGTLHDGAWTKLERTVLFADPRMARVLEPPPAGLEVRGSRQIALPGGKVVSLPQAGGDRVISMALSPGGDAVAFAGISDACFNHPETALYVADVAGGKVKSVHRGKGLQRVRWLDDKRFVYEAAPGELRIWDLVGRRSTDGIADRYGVALGAVSNTKPSATCPPRPEDAEPPDDADAPDAPDALPTPAPASGGD